MRDHGADASRPGTGFTRATTTLHTLDPAATDTSDLGVLREVIGEARVVCLGESAHAVSEFYLLKDRLFRYLATELGFTAFVMESGFAEGLAVNEWIHGGAGEIGHLSRSGVTYEFGDSDLFRTQLAWMRERALAGRPLNFYGMDLPGASVDPGAAVTVCLSRLPPRA